MVRRAPQHPPAAPPASAAEAAPHVRHFTVKLLDRQDGEGVNKQMIAETLFLAAFDALDRLPEDEARSVARRVHEGSYNRMTGDGATGSDAIEAHPSAAPAGFPKQARPRPPR